MNNSKITYIEALKKAQGLKIAEVNPYLDVSEMCIRDRCL